MTDWLGRLRELETKREAGFIDADGGYDVLADRAWDRTALRLFPLLLNVAEAATVYRAAWYDDEAPDTVILTWWNALRDALAALEQAAKEQT